MLYGLGHAASTSIFSSYTFAKPFMLESHLSELYTGSFIERPQIRNRTIQKILNDVTYDDFINKTYIGKHVKIYGNSFDIDQES
jgi:hypothetical protein